MKRRSWIVLALLAALCPAAGRAADTYPSRSLRIILPNAPGGSAEATARIIGNGITALTHQAVLVEPKPGAAGNLAAAYAAAAKPDGYTIFFAFPGTHGVNANIYKHLQYSPMGDFKAVTLSWRAPYFLYIRKQAPFHTVKELIDYARANPGKLNFGTAGKTDPTNIELLLFNVLAGTKILGVPYKGIGEAVQDVAAGRIDAAFATAATGIQFVQSGQADIIGISFDKALPDYPNIPPISDTLPGFQFTSWDGAMVQAATPASRIDEVNALFRKVLAQPDIIERFKNLGLYVAPTTPQEMTDFINADTARIGKALKAAGIMPE